jgi:HSP20 family molecular chaperone IbpA
VNEWIQEEVNQTRLDLYQMILTIIRNIDVHEDDSGPILVRKRKLNSTKSGSVPAYWNVILVHPPKDFNSSSYVYKLSQICNGDIDWTNVFHNHSKNLKSNFQESLQYDVEWFRANRPKLMEAVVTLTTVKNRLIYLTNFSKKRTKNTNSATQPPSPDSSPITPPPPPMQTVSVPIPTSETYEDTLHISVNPPTIPYDIYRSPEAYYIVVDLPGLLPGRDLFVQTDDSARIYIKGERRLDFVVPNVMELVRQRNFGPFLIELFLPPSIDFSKTEQNFVNGVLTIRCPIKFRVQFSLPITELEE